MVDLFHLFNQIERKKVLIFGDAMLDVYTFGQVERISPEAPVCVCRVSKEEKKPGGAGNAILNLIALGMEVVACVRVGFDEAGGAFVSALSDEDVDVRAIFHDRECQTPKKNRLIAGQQQLLRIDYEAVQPLSSELESKIIRILPSLFDGVAVVAISDYGKGFLTERLLQEIIAIGKNRKIPLLVDPKGTNFSKYRGVTVIKPNLSEVIGAAQLGKEAPLEAMALKLIRETETEYLLVTRAEKGISLFSKNGTREDFPAEVREIKDVTGAGDTVLATIALALANRLPLEQGCRLANIAAGLAVEKIGCTEITLGEVAQRLLKMNPLTKIFDEKHLYTLKTAMQDDPFIMLEISAKETLSFSFFEGMRLLKKRHTALYLMIYITDSEENEAFAPMCASLTEVDYIILQGESGGFPLIPSARYVFHQGCLVEEELSSVR